MKTEDNAKETIYGDDSLNSFHALVAQISSPELRSYFREWALKNIQILQVEWSKDNDAPECVEKYYARQQFYRIAEALFEQTETTTNTFYVSPCWQNINRKTVYVIGRRK